MQLHELKLNNKRKKRKTIGRGGKKGTYSGKGNKGQKARSGAHVYPLFEGGRSTLIEHMKKKRGFKSLNDKNVVIKISKLEKAFKNGDKVTKEALIKSGLAGKMAIKKTFKILGGDKIKVKLVIDKGILLSASAKEAILAAGGEISKDQKTVSKEQK